MANARAKSKLGGSTTRGVTDAPDPVDPRVFRQLATTVRRLLPKTTPASMKIMEAIIKHLNGSKLASME